MQCVLGSRHSNLCLSFLSYYTVKAAKKLKSCLCCIPGEGDEEVEDDEDANEGSNGEGSSKPKIDLSIPGAFATNTNRYVDGKAGFAFDPTKFRK